VWGTCAGAIFLSKDARRSQPLLGVMDITVERNAFGRQVDSFEVDLPVPYMADAGLPTVPYHAIFIRAPLIDAVSGSTEILSSLPDGRIVAARQGKLLATSFHPELTGDDRFHRYFVHLANGA
jgi:5'-phosphate synthase pdxT subunit